MSMQISGKCLLPPARAHQSLVWCVVFFETSGFEPINKKKEKRSQTFSPRPIYILLLANISLIAARHNVAFDTCMYSSIGGLYCTENDEIEIIDILKIWSLHMSLCPY